MDHLDRIALFLAVAIVIFVIFIPPAVGLGDNGDYCKICSRFDLYLPNHTYAYADTTYNFDPQHHWTSDFVTPEIPIAWLAVRLNRIFNTKTFDMRWMGAMHAVLYLVIFYLALPLLRGLSKIRRAILMAVILFILFDINYVSSLTSFYMDTAAWIFLCLSVVCYLRTLRWPTNKNRAALLVSLALLMTAKTQHLVVGIGMAAVIFVTHRQLGFVRKWLWSAVATTAAAWAIAWIGTPQGYTAIPVFNIVFYDILPHSDNVSRDLADLGLDDSYRRYIGTHTYMQGSPMSDPNFVKEFERRVGHIKLAEYYLRHPAKTWAMFTGALAEAGHQRPYLGNYDRSTGAQPNQESNAFSLWSSLKKNIFWHHGVWYLAYVLVLLGAIVVLAWKLRGIRVAVIAFAVVTILETLIASLGDVLDTLRHEWIFNALTDLGVVLLAALLVHAVGRRATISEQDVANHALAESAV